VQRKFNNLKLNNYDDSQYMYQASGILIPEDTLRPVFVTQLLDFADYAAVSQGIPAYSKRQGGPSPGLLPRAYCLLRQKSPICFFRPDNRAATAHEAPRSRTKSMSNVFSLLKKS
jgi:hypothetical protein